MRQPSALYKRHRFPGEIISHAVWLYYRFLLSYRRRVVGEWGSAPRVVITDTLASYPHAVRRVLPGVEHRRYKGLNNRAENSHRPTRRRERVLQRFKSPEHAQQFLSPYGPISDHFRARRHLFSAPEYHQLLRTRCAEWREVIGLAAAA